MRWHADPSGADDRYEDFDESRIRERPNPKANRPRSKQRPEHRDAVRARVFSVDRGRYRTLVAEDTAEEHEVTATRARELRRQAIVTGDFVDLVGDTSGAEGSLARVVRVAERSTILRRSADDTDRVERIVVANADQLMIVVAAANPEPRPRLIDRYLVAAYDAGIEPLLCVTKCDLADPAELLSSFSSLEIPTFLSRPGAMPLEPLRAALHGHSTVFVGHSGVGKSTLVNELAPHAERAIGEVNAVTGRGRHTSSSTVALRVDGGWIVDTPGVRSFGLGHVRAENIVRAFTDLAPWWEQCPRGCPHLPDSLDCRLVEAERDGELTAAQSARRDSLQRLLVTLGSVSAW